MATSGVAEGRAAKGRRRSDDKVSSGWAQLWQGFVTSKILTLIAVVYLGGGILASVQIISHTQASTDAIERMFKIYGEKNESEEALEQYKDDHPLIGTLFGGMVHKELQLPSAAKADEAFHSELPHEEQINRDESSIVAWWSLGFICASLLYVLAAITLARSLLARSVIFSMTLCSVFSFFIGILAPAMIIWTTPAVPLASTKLEFVMQHEVRGIFRIIWELLTNDHYIIGGFLFAFSILTPLTKMGLTFFATATYSPRLNFRIGSFLHTIGKWSMADVFVAAILLALYALKFQEATKSIPAAGLYFFIGYCMLSMCTTELLVRSGLVKDAEDTPAELDFGIIVGLFAVFICFVAAGSMYTYQQYTQFKKNPVKISTLPEKLDNADLVLPGHKQK